MERYSSETKAVGFANKVIFDNILMGKQLDSFP